MRKNNSPGNPPPIEEKINAITAGLRPCADDHHFIIDNGVQKSEIHYYSGDDEVSGIKIDGAIAAKIKNIDGVTRNFLFMSTPDTAFQGDLLIPGAQTIGCFIGIGNPSSTTILVVEDYICGLSLHLDTGFGVAVTLYPENLEPVVTALRNKFADKVLVICTGGRCSDDIQTSIDTANNVGAKVGALVATPIKGTTSFIEMSHRLDGCAVMEAIDTAPEAEEPYQSNEKKEEAFSVSAPSLWSGEVNGEALVADIVAFIERHVSLPPGAAIGIALWVLFTYTTVIARIAPILAILSPVRHCGKTTLLGIVARLVFRPLPSSNITAAVLFRTVHKWSPTLLIDEADTHLFKSDEMNGIFNSGHTRDAAFVYRMGAGNTPERFNTFGAKSIAMIGKPPETLMDRSIAIHQQRKRVDEFKQKLRPSSESELFALRARIARFSRDNMDAIAAADFDAPDLKNDRASDNWEPLFAIAHVIGSQCFSQAVESSVLLTLKHAQISSTSEDLLRDIHTVFGTTKAKKLSTFQLIEALCKDQELPWGTSNRGGPINPVALAALLGAFDIKSKNLRFAGDTISKGYELAQFADAFSRYVKEVRE